MDVGAVLVPHRPRHTLSEAARGRLGADVVVPFLCPGSFGELPDRHAGRTEWWQVERPGTHVEGFTAIRR